MRVFAAVLLLAGLGVLCGVASADTVPLPPVPTVPTVTVPAPPPVPVPVPLPPAPKPPPPPVVTVPVTTTTSSTAPIVSGATGSLPGAPGVSSSSPSSSSYGSAASGSSSPSSTSSSSSSGASATGGGSTGPRAEHFHTSRQWIGTTGSKRRRTTTLTFVLQQAGPVILTVNQVSPACVGFGRLTVAGRKGLNRVRFAGVVHGKRLTPGTYRISIRKAGGVVVRRVTIVVVGGSAPTLEELHALKRANTCGGGEASAAAYSSSSGSSDTSSAAPLPAQGLPKPKTAAAGLGPARTPDLHSGVLGSSVEKTARALQPLLIALLAFSILLLGMASLPREAVPGPRMHEALARHRVELAALGAVALLAVAVAFLLT